MQISRFEFWFQQISILYIVSKTEHIDKSNITNQRVWRTRNWNRTQGEPIYRRDILRWRENSTTWRSTIKWLQKYLLLQKKEAKEKKAKDCSSECQMGSDYQDHRRNSWGKAGQGKQIYKWRMVWWRMPINKRNRKNPAYKKMQQQHKTRQTTEEYNYWVMPEKLRTSTAWKIVGNIKYYKEGSTINQWQETPSKSNYQSL